MKLEQTPTRLAFKLGIPHVNHTEVVFDRTNGQASIKRVMFFWPMKPRDMPLSDISSAVLIVDNKNVGETSSRSVYPQLILKSGKRMNLASVAEGSAKKAVELMNAFLQQAA